MSAAVKISETEFQAQVIDAAHLFGWQHLHVRRSIGKGKQWVTSTNRSGWPDLLLWRPGSPLVALELKAEKGRATPDQLQVLAELEATGVVRTMVARPSDFDAVLELLRGSPAGGRIGGTNCHASVTNLPTPGAIVPQAGQAESA